MIRSPFEGGYTLDFLGARRTDRFHDFGEPVRRELIG
jgi:hypothetical protein